MKLRALMGALAVVAASLGGADAGAQAPAVPAIVRVSVPAINTGLLRPGVERFTVYMVEGNRRDLLARVTDEVSFVEMAPGDTVLRRVYTWATGEASYSRVDTILADRTDLTLRRYASHGAGTVSSVDWVDGHLRGELRVDGKPMPMNAWLNARVYHDGMLDLVARSSVLASGFSATFSTFSPASGTIAPAALSVTGADSIGSPQWRVQSEVRGMLTTFWVDRRSHRVLREARYMGKGFRIELVPVSASAVAASR